MGTNMTLSIGNILEAGNQTFKVVAEISENRFLTAIIVRGNLGDIETGQYAEVYIDNTSVNRPNTFAALKTKGKTLSFVHSSLTPEAVNSLHKAMARYSTVEGSRGNGDQTHKANGRPRTIPNHVSPQVPVSLWDKSKRLFYSLIFFILAGLSVYLLVWYFETSKGGVVRAGFFIAPIMFGWYGLKYLINFFSYLFTSRDSI